MNTAVETKIIAPALARGLDARNALNCKQSIRDIRALSRPVQEAKERRTAAPVIRTAGERGKFNGKVIIQIASTNPRKEGTHGFNSFAIIIDNGGEISFEDYRAKGGRNNDLQWDIDHGYIRLEDN